MQITVIRGDANYALDFVLTDANETVINLTGAELLFKAQLAGTKELAFSASMSIVTAVDGKCRYTVVAGNFDVAGEYTAEIQATLQSEAIITFGDINITVKSDLPISN